MEVGQPCGGALTPKHLGLELEEIGDGTLGMELEETCWEFPDYSRTTQKSLVCFPGWCKRNENPPIPHS